MDDPTTQNGDYKILSWTGTPATAPELTEQLIPDAAQSNLRSCNLGFELSDRPFS